MTAEPRQNLKLKNLTKSGFCECQGRTGRTVNIRAGDPPPHRPIVRKHNSYLKRNEEFLCIQDGGQKSNQFQSLENTNRSFRSIF